MEASIWRLSLHPKRCATAAGRLGVRVVEHETFAVQAARVLQNCASEKDIRFPVDK